MPPASSSPSLTNKQELFIKEYLVDCNATQAAIRAGYSPDTAYSIGQENLKKPVIKVRIDAGLQRISNKAEVTAEWVRQKLKENLERSMQAEPVYDAEGNVTGVYKYHGTVANRALELLGKDRGMFTDKLELSLTNDAKSIVQRLAQLAIECCAEDKRERLLQGLEEVKGEYNAK